MAQQPVVRTEDTLPFLLEAAVRLRIMDLQAQDDEAFYATWRAWTDPAVLAICGVWDEQILFGGAKRGATAMAFNALAKSLAALAFMPGGVSLFGHYEAVRGARGVERRGGTEETSGRSTGVPAEYSSAGAERGTQSDVETVSIGEAP